MTKKNKDKLEARARQKTLGGSYLNHLRTVGGAGAAQTSLDLFETISNEIRRLHPEAKLAFNERDNRLDVQIGSNSFSLLTPYNETPAWPVLMVPQHNKGPGGWGASGDWQCENLGDVRTVLRWPGVLPSGSFSDVNEIRDDKENPSKHTWNEVGRNAFITRFECSRCKARLSVNFGETVEEVARIGFDNWRKKEAGKLGPEGTISRAMGVAAIPSVCPGATSDDKTNREGYTMTRYFTLDCDWETSERAGAGGMFQVSGLFEDNEDVTHLVDQGVHWLSTEALRKHLEAKLQCNVDLDVDEADEDPVYPASEPLNRSFRRGFAPAFGPTPRPARRACAAYGPAAQQRHPDEHPAASNVPAVSA